MVSEKKSLKERKEHIDNHDAQPDKNYALYKTPDIAVRLLTTGCLSRIIQNYRKHMRTFNMKSAKYNKRYITFVRFN